MKTVSQWLREACYRDAFHRASFFAILEAARPGWSKEIQWGCVENGMGDVP